MNTPNLSPKLLPIIIPFALFFLLLLTGCSSTQLLSKSDTLKIKGTARVINTEGKHWLTKDLILDEEKLEATSLRDKSRLKLIREDVAEIRRNNHLKGMYKGAAIGAGIGASLGLLAGIGDPTVAIGMGTSMGLTGGIIGLIGGYSQTYLLTDSNSLSLENNKQSRHFRNRYYAGLELRGAWGTTPNGQQTNTLGALTRLSTTSAVLDAGITLSPELLIGLRFSGLNEGQNNPLRSFDESFIDIYLVATYFPVGKGRFWRFGLGSVFYDYWNWDRNYTFNTDDGKYINPANYKDNYNKTGIAGLVGLGYAFWLGEHWNITVSADWNNYFFTNENASHVFSFNIGSYWF